MLKEINIKVPDEWIKDLPKEKLIFKQVFKLGINQYKLEKAIKFYQTNLGSVGFIAEQVGIEKEKLIKELRSLGLEPDFSDQTLEEELSEWE